MILVIVLLAMWPFHHKQAPIEPVRACEKAGELYFFEGDGVIGFGPSCDAAIHNWAIRHVDPVKMSRA